MELSELIAAHGRLVYAIAFAWAFFEGETFVLFGGIAAAQGLIDPFLLGLAAGTGSFCGDQAWFFVGRRFGTRVLHRFPGWRARAELPLRLLERYDVLFILTFRFIYGIRNISSFSLGLSRIQRRRFMLLNLAGSAIWVTSFVGAGYLLGGVFHLAFGNIVEHLGLVGIAVVALTVLGMLLGRRPKKTRTV